jgi:hypothetical protein
MNNELPDSPNAASSLEARFAKRPHVLARLHEIADMMDQAISQGATADEAEEMVIKKLRQLGADVLGDFAQQRHDQCLQEAQVKNPGAIRQRKKN